MFILLPVGMNYRTERLPIVTFSLIGINVLVYLVSLFFLFQTQGESIWWTFHYLWLIPVKSYLWTYLTSMFVHAGFFHLLGNMIFLFLFGCCVEDMIGRCRFLGFYLAGGIISNLSHIALSPEHFLSDMPMGGASGAISACMGMYLLLRANADIEFKYFYYFFRPGVGEFTTPAWLAISFWFLNVLFWTGLGLVYHHSGGGVAFGAHVGGFVAGLGLIGLYHAVERRRSETPVVETPAPVVPRVRVVARRANAPIETPSIYLHDGETQSGPFTLTQVQDMLMQGLASRDSLYWSEGMEEWQSVVDLVDSPTR